MNNPQRPALKSKATLYGLSNPMARGNILKQDRDAEFQRQTVFKGKPKVVAGVRRDGPSHY